MLRLAFSAAKSVWPELKLLPLRAAVALGAAGLGEPVRPGRLIRSYAVILPIGLAVWWLLSRFTLVMSPSIDAWVIRKAVGPIRRGDLVSFVLHHPLAGPRAVNVTKYALCFPGDQIAMTEKPSHLALGLDGYYYCNGRLLGVSKPVGHDGRRIRHWRPLLPVISSGLIYVGSSHPNGFDSRYYGPVPGSRLTRMKKLL